MKFIFLAALFFGANGAQAFVGVLNGDDKYRLGCQVQVLSYQEILDESTNSLPDRYEFSNIKRVITLRVNFQKDYEQVITVTSPLNAELNSYETTRLVGLNPINEVRNEEVVVNIEPPTGKILNLQYRRDAWKKVGGLEIGAVENACNGLTLAE